ncbi:hypothetical protein D049_2117A, partial [Vibrio parahaemolyticus VPTS-2010]
MDKGIFL